MGLNVLLLADSTSRWAQALREMSGRLEEIPGDEAFPAYLESVIAGFYERAGRVRLKDGTIGSVTISGTVSPAGGNFDEPVTQATLKVVGAFHGLLRARSDARRFPAIDPLDSWSKYRSVIEQNRVENLRSILRKGADVEQMMKVVGEEGTAMDDFVMFLKKELIDAVYLQQNAFNDEDASSSVDRQKASFAVLETVVTETYAYTDKGEARHAFLKLQQAFIDWNNTPMGVADYDVRRDAVLKLVTEAPHA
jgi:V/A-type H+-transporting ATPase subunit A